VTTLLRHSKGGQFVAHVKALPGNPYDGHTLAAVIPEMEQQVGVTLNRIFTDAGYRGHNAPPDYGFRIYTVGQKRRMTEQIKRQMRRRRRPSSDISKPSIAWAETIWPAAPATPPTRCWPPPATTSAA
jgi:hypothetical protein